MRLTVTEQTRFNITLAFLFAILATACRGTWLAAELSTKIDVLWHEGGHAEVSPQIPPLALK